MARRLVEAGVPFVNVYDFKQQGQNWDSHADNFNQHKDYLLPPADQSLSALIEDLDERGLLDSTLVVAMGEFGRTPKISNRAAREHWQHCYFSIWAGAGIEPGRCIGTSDAKGEFPVTRPITPLMAGTTIAELCGVGAQQRAELKVLDGGSVIDELL